MYGRGHSLRWIVVASFVIFAFLAIGSLLVDRYKLLGQTLGPSPVPTSVATPTSLVAPQGTATAAPKASPVVPSPSAVLTPTPRPAATSPNDLLYMVDKQYAIPASYAPDDLVALTTVRTTTANQKVRRLVLPSLEKLIADAKAAGFDLVVSSAYRSYAEQESVHAYWERSLGKAEADKVSAIAGHSEHQLGTTVDVTSATVAFDLTEKFGSTPEGKWLKANAHRYGFIISYPEGKEAVTGYAYEPWHIRYVGVENASAIQQRGVTLGEYLRSNR